MASETYEDAFSSLATPQAQPPQADVPILAQQPGMGDALNNQVSPLIVPGPPKTPEEANTRRQGWSTFVTKMQTDPSFQLAMMRFGTQLMQPVPAGQTSMGHFGQALGGSVDYLTALRESERVTQLQNDKNRREEAESRSNIEAQQARTKLTGVETTAREQATRFEGELHPLNLDVAKQRVKEGDAKIKKLEGELKVMDNEFKSDIHDPEQIKKREQLKLDLDRARIQQAQAAAAASGASASASAAHARLYDRQVKDLEKGGKITGHTQHVDPNTGAVTISWRRSNDSQPGGMQIRPGLDPVAAASVAKQEAKQLKKDDKWVQDRTRQLQETQTTYFGAQPQDDEATGFGTNERGRGGQGTSQTQVPPMTGPTSNTFIRDKDGKIVPSGKQTSSVSSLPAAGKLTKPKLKEEGETPLSMAVGATRGAITDTLSAATSGESMRSAFLELVNSGEFSTVHRDVIRNAIASGALQPEEKKIAESMLADLNKKK